jgi:hypothetical protein
MTFVGLTSSAFAGVENTGCGVPKKREDLL